MRWMGWSWPDLLVCPADIRSKIIELLNKAAEKSGTTSRSDERGTF